MQPQATERLSAAEVVLAPPPDANGAGLRSLLDEVLSATASPKAQSRFDQFLNESDPWKALLHWLGGLGGLQRGRDFRRQVSLLLSRAIADIDALINSQVNAILHLPRLQKLEAAWRGLHYLVEQVAEGENIKVKLLSVSWAELARDAERALEFDQSHLFRKVYSEEFGHPGGEPFSLLLGDYEVTHKISAEHPTDDVSVLSAIAQVAAASFAPFITGAHPSLLELNNFAELERPSDLARTFDQVDYLKWKALRKSEDSRFLGITAPHVLMRLPYGDDINRIDGCRFREEVHEGTRKGYLWGSAVYPFGAVVIRAFAESGWPAAIRGVIRGENTGGVVSGLPVQCFDTDAPGVIPKSLTDVVLTDTLEKELSDLGLIPLCQCQDTGLLAFYGNQSVQQPKVYEEQAATTNARLSSMLQYMLCVSRFAHYLKVITRDRVGLFTGAFECEIYLRKWLAQFVTATESAKPEHKARYPLREASVKVQEIPGKPGTYKCVAHLRPHFQLDAMVSSLRLVTDLAPAVRNG